MLENIGSIVLIWKIVIATVQHLYKYIKIFINSNLKLTAYTIVCEGKAKEALDFSILVYSYIFAGMNFQDEIPKLHIV